MTTEPTPLPARERGSACGDGRLSLFQGYGVEAEVMIVDAHTLDVRPVADRLLTAVAGVPSAEVEMGPIAWSNELALHVLELRTNGPAASLRGLSARFHAALLHADRIVGEMGCRLLPGGVHPWMDPGRETRIWPHEHTEVYRTFDRIFSCRGHGWSNLQSTHLNLPFGDAREFVALHAVVRMLLPLVPALAAASPVLDGRIQPVLDARLAEYARNAARVPSVTGRIVPEPVTSPEAYRRSILGRIYRDLEALDPEGVLRHEWVNARGAIARFDRGSIEVRLVDAQECPGADLAVTALQAEVLRGLVERALDDPAPFNALPTGRLASLLADTVREGERARVAWPRFLELLGIGDPPRPRRAGEIWTELVARIGTGTGEPLEEWREPLEVILGEGPLARRILRILGRDPGRDRLREVWLRLGEALRANRPFRS